MTTTNKTNATETVTISDAFRNAFEAHPQRDTDPALALTSARETAEEMVPAGVTGIFDDETLTFRADEDEEECYGLTFSNWA